MEFSAQVAIAPFMVRDVMFFDKVLTDTQIQQIGWLP